MKKYILILSAVGFPSKINVNQGIFTFEQAKELKKKNFNLILIDLLSNKNSENYIDSYKGIKIVRLVNAKWNIFKIIENFFFIYKILNKKKISFSISSFEHIKSFIYISLYKFKKTCIIHGSDAIPQNYLKRIFLIFFYNQMYKIFTVSNYTKRVLINHFPSKQIRKKTIVISNGFSKKKLLKVDKNFEKKIITQTKNKKIILSIGNLVHRKNQISILKIMKHIQNQSNDFILIIIGQGENEKALKKFALKNLKEKSYIFFNNIDDLKVSTLLKLSKYFILLPKKYKNQFEGFGIVYLEAMFTKNFVIGTDNGGIKDILKNNYNSIVFKENFSEIVVAKKIISLNLNNKFFKKIVKNGYYFCKDFTWKKNTENILINIEK